MLACEIDFRGKSNPDGGRKGIYIFPALGWNMRVPGVESSSYLFVCRDCSTYVDGESNEVSHEKCFHLRNFSLQTCQGAINIRKELLVKGKLTIGICAAIHPAVVGRASHWPFQSNQSIPPPFLPFRFFFPRAVYHMNRPILLAWSVHPEYLQRSNEAAAAR